MKKSVFACGALLLVGSTLAQDRFRIGAGWIYEDFAEARAIAERESKPLFVVFRCVP